MDGLPVGVSLLAALVRFSTLRAPWNLASPARTGTKVPVLSVTYASEGRVKVATSDPVAKVGTKVWVRGALKMGVATVTSRTVSVAALEFLELNELVTSQRQPDWSLLGHFVGSSVTVAVVAPDTSALSERASQSEVPGI